MAAQLGLFGSEQALVVRRSRRAQRLSLRVFPHGVVEVVAPERAGEASIRRFVHEHADWIARTRRYFQAVHAPTSFDPPREIALVAAGERWTVDYRRGARHLHQRLAPGGGQLVLDGPDDPCWQRQHLRAWLMDRARRVLPPWLERVSAESGLEYAGATVRRQRSRWGSCSVRRTISLNCALLFLEPALVRHLFLHELAHTRHLNHSRSFWRLLERLSPEFETRERQLSEAWRLVPGWVSYDPPSVNRP
jgi:predicted metal-dependent hydrolase